MHSSSVQNIILLLTSLTSIILTQNTLFALVSPETGSCLACHESIYPGIVQSWSMSKHSRKGIGCFECHGKGNAGHKDSFEHNGFTIHLVVTPNDCRRCHPIEAGEYSENMMGYAYDNLMKNRLYLDLEKNINFNGLPNKTLSPALKKELRSDSCLYCHGTRVDVKGWSKKDTLFGRLRFPRLAGWPNQGVGRLNPDGSRGSCTSCHPRHSFSIEVARKPYTCAQCHKGPDTPAYKVYMVSKHGNLYKSMGDRFNFKDIPWKIGKDFTVPTCATCHMSKVVTPTGEIVLKRTHRVSDRLFYRILGNPYAHPHPRSPRTYELKNKQGIQIPVSLDGKLPADDLQLIDKQTQVQRRAKMEKLCTRCHSSDWAASHFNRLDQVITTTNNVVQNATLAMMTYWDRGMLTGLKDKQSLFDEPLEKKWTELWLFYANSARFSAAMAGGGDYGVFANGRFFMDRSLTEIINFHRQQKN